MTNQTVSRHEKTAASRNGGELEALDSKQWDDLFFRHNFDDTGSYPTSGSLSQSPDIIPAGLNAYADPTQLIADGNWSKDFGSSADALTPNYIYLRGTNLGAAKTTGQVYLYAAKASLLLFPTNPLDPTKGWSQNPIKTQQGAEYVTVEADASKRFVTANPFQWIPDAIFGDHYCLVGRVVTAANPNPIPTSGNLNDFGAYISTHPNMSWRNINLQNPSAPIWNTNVDYEQGDKGGDVIALLVCENCPVGSDVAMSASAPGTSPSFVIPRTRIDANTIKDGVPTWTKSLLVTIPANWSSNVTFTWWSNNFQPLPDMKVSLQAIMPQPSRHWDPALERFARPLEELGVFDLELDGHVGPTKGLVLGSQTMKGVAPLMPPDPSHGQTAATASSILVSGLAWQDTTSSVVSQSVTPHDIAIDRVPSKGVETEVLMLTGRPKPAAAGTDADLTVDVALNGGPTDGDTFFLLVARNVPAGCEVWFKNQTGDVPIAAPPTVVKPPSPFTVTTLVDLPADYSATVRVFLRLDGKVLPPDWSLQFQAIQPEPGGSRQAPRIDQDGAPTPGKLLGSVTIKR